MPRLPTRLTSALLVFFAAAGLSAAGTFLYLQHTLRGNLERHIGERLGTSAQVGFARIGLLPYRLHLAGIAVDNPDGFRDRHFLKARVLTLQVGDYARSPRLITSPQMTLDGLEVWIEHQGRRSNSAVIQGNLARFERRHRVTRDDKLKLVIHELRIRNIQAQLRAGADTTTAEMPEIVLRNVGAARGGVTIGELADIVTRAVLRAVVRSEFERELDQRKQEQKRALGRKLERLFD